eukprot:m.205560 g.205560  ORF g.205560 m.205560 type:complete len:442 (-) comp22997_c0_seq1:178-1503(-)
MWAYARTVSMCALAVLGRTANAAVGATSTTVTEAVATQASAGDFCAFDNIFGAGAPPYYVAYHLGKQAGTASPDTVLPPPAITIDGSLDESVWQEVAFTRSNPDICGDATHCPASNGRYKDYPCGTNCCSEKLKPNTCGTPRYTTRQKIRWDDNYLYVGAEIEEPQVWANNTKHDSVIFTDNDYEVFISPDGSNHYYKEYEMNARGAWWDLCLNKPYTNGGYENSSRVFNQSGWDDPGLRTAAKVLGCTLNDPMSGPCRGWSVEIAFPLAAISLNNTNTVPPKAGQYWRINFSRVEYKVRVEGNHYVKDTSRPCDNWLWAPLGIVDVHQPERWGYVQFATGDINATEPVRDPDWAIRSVAMQLYYAQEAYKAGHGSFTTNVDSLAQFAPLGPAALNGTCTHVPTVTLTDRGGVPGYKAMVASRSEPARTATITDDRYLLVQ